jgi:hypothetical protein
MKTAAIVASLTVVGSIAYAAGSQGTAGKQPPLMPSGSQAHSMQESADEQSRRLDHPQEGHQIPRSIQSLTESGCPPFALEYWFSPTPHLIGCTFGLSPGVLTNATGVADIDGDGRAEHVTMNRLAVASALYGAPIDNTNPNSAQNALLSVSEVERVGSEYQAREKRIPIFDASIGPWCLANLPQPAPPNRMIAIYLIESGGVGPLSGWRDMDGDGDLDLVCRVTDEATWNAQIWLENTGFQHTNPIAADLNHDGNVDGADLGLLLYAWGQTQ